MYEELAFRIELFGDEIERLMTLHPLTGEVISEDSELYVSPRLALRGRPGADGACHRRHRGRAGRSGSASSRHGGKLLEAQRLRHAHAVRHRDDARRSAAARGSRTTRGTSTAARPGSPPYCLLDYFPEDFLLLIDESHVDRPADRRACTRATARASGPWSSYGFRLPSAIDNRPLTLEEFLDRIGQTIYRVGHARAVRAAARRRRGRRAGHPADRPGRPRGRGQADQGPDRRPDARDQAARRARTSGCWSRRSPRRWPRTSPTTCWRMGIRARYLH